MDQTTVASIYLGSVGDSETYLRALLMLVEFTNNLSNKKHKNVGLIIRYAFNNLIEYQKNPLHYFGFHFGL